MEYRSLTLILACCLAALGTVQSQSGFPDLDDLLTPFRTDCDGAREIYQVPVEDDGESNAIFDEMRAGKCEKRQWMNS